MKVILNQQHSPKKSGFTPDFTRILRFVFKPIADIASIIMNLLNSLKGKNIHRGAPKLVAHVVIRDAPIKYKMKKGKDFFKDNFCPSLFLFFLFS